MRGGGIGFAESTVCPYVHGRCVLNQVQCIGKQYLYYFVSGGNLTWMALAFGSNCDILCAFLLSAVISLWQWCTCCLQNSSRLKRTDCHEKFHTEENAGKSMII